VRVNFKAVVPPSSALVAAPVIKETVIRRKEPFLIGYRVKNRTQKAIFTRVVHGVEPAGLNRHLRMFECSLLLPIKLSPGEQSNYSTTYMIDGDLPDGVKELTVTYEFQLEN
jgi:cytochrome c oxidase assembly protein Cox11